jgi:arginine exporter protein ArgO
VTDTRDSKGRRLAVTTAIVFFISLAFPIGAGLSRDPALLPRVWGILDVIIAFILAALAILIAWRFDKSVDEEIQRSSYHAYRSLINVVLIVLVIFLVGGDRIRWTTFLPGIAWRGWLLFYALPAWLAAFRGQLPVPREHR